MKKLYIFSLFLLSLSVSEKIQAQDAGKAVSLDGIDDYVSIPLLDHFLANFTLECWINVPTYDGNVHYLSISKYAEVIIGDYSSGVISTWAAGLSPVDAGSDNVASQPTLGANEWHHFAFTFDGTTQKVYIDWSLEIEQATTG